MTTVSNKHQATSKQRTTLQDLIFFLLIKATSNKPAASSPVNA